MQSGAMPYQQMLQMGQNSVGGLGELLSSLFTNPSAPYQAGMNQLQQYLQQMQGLQQPYMQAGQQGITGMQNMLGNMSNPSQFINNLMGQYQQSPTAQYQQQQAMRAAQNMGSASGLTGSTPLQLQAQQNASNISSQDMQNWLGNVLGINSQAMQGYGNMMNVGQNATNNLTTQMGNYGTDMGQLAFGQQYAQNQNTGQGIQGLLNFMTGM